MPLKISNWFARSPLLESFELPAWAVAKPSSETKKFLVLGNCQARSMGECLQALSRRVTARGVEIKLPDMVEEFARKNDRFHSILSQYDFILTQPSYAPLIKTHFPNLSTQVELFPAVSFSAYHPDLVYIKVRSTNSYLCGPLGHYNSAIAFWGFSHGLDPKETLELFNSHTYEALGYFRFWKSSRQALIEQGKDANVSLAEYLDKWSSAGCFMHSINHPMLHVIADIAENVLDRVEIRSAKMGSFYLADEQADGPVWPVFPEIAAQLGVSGSYNFKVEKGVSLPERPVMMLDLREFIEASFENFGRHATDDVVCDRMTHEAFRTFRATPRQSHADGSREVESAPQESSHTVVDRTNPYTDLPKHQFWRSAVSSLPMEAVDPAVSGRFQFSRDTKVATAGSCFAQNISRTLQSRGYSFYLAETQDSLTPDEARKRNYGIFSARFGNVYTAKQLLQLYERAFGMLIPVESAWRRGDGRYVDPFRPQIEPEGYESPQSVADARRVHLDAVREMFRSLDVLIFTLGLTESWQSKGDGAVFPLAPGVAGGRLNRSRHEFVNFQVEEIVADLDRFLNLLRTVNARARMILTVSPVPLIATYEQQHVLVANTYSKSALRVAANEVCADRPNCAYFPSYEIITGNHARGLYFDSDLRTVTSNGVDHVMRLFLKHYFGEQGAGIDADAALLQELRSVSDIVCDEEALDRR
ncbi:MAG TPA: GSCFA domain-containing protein [Steroidobacteraceae bacterium]|nr:GSCFA domain-containing protein [Steroidobacteraceae bacterium]